MNDANQNVVGILLGLLVGTFLAVITIQSYGSPPPTKNNVLILTENNTVSLNLPITSQVAGQVQAELMNSSRRLRPVDPIYLVLNSPGGSIPDGMNIIETAKGLPQEVRTISMFSASMSFIISQYLGKRYALESATLMSHPATVEGLGGQVPGNMIQRAMAFANQIDQISSTIADRAHMPREAYTERIRSEMWLTAQEAQQLRFVDQVVRVQCDASLQGPTKPQELNTIFGRVKVRWYKCPLIQVPYSVEFAQGVSSQGQEALELMLYNRQQYINKYGVPKLFN